MDQATIDLLTRYYRQMGLDTADIAANIATAGRNQNFLNNELSSAQQHFAGISDAASTLATSLRDSVQSLSRGDSNTKRLLGSFRTLEGVASKFKYDMLDYSVMSEKEIKRNITKIKQEKDLLETMILQGQVTGDAAREAADVVSQSAELLRLAEERLKEEKKIQRQLGLTGAAVDGIVGALGKIGINSTFFSDMKEDMRDAAKSGGSLKVVTTATAGLMKGIGQSLTDPLTVITFLLTQALKANKQTVELGKAIGKESSVYRENLVSISRTSNNINVTTENLVGAFNELAQASGYVYEYSADQLTTQVKLTKQVGLQADEAAQIQRFGVLNNKTSEQTYNSFVKGLTAARNQYKVGVDFKATLAEATKVSGQLAANLGFNPERISKAVVAAKAFGMTLDQVAKSGESLLNFEDSIGNQLKAELLTGKQLNLERARAAALQGDQATLAEELAKNVGTAAEFTKMNVLQQKSLAESVGMTADELSNTLRKREEAIASGKSLAQITEEEAKQALERQNVQDKFNNAMLKLQDVVGNLVAGPFGQLLDIVSNIANVILKIIQPFVSIAGAVLSPILGGINSVVGAFTTANDMVGYGARTLITPTGAVALNNNDTVIAGTNLFKGDDVASFPKGKLSLGGGSGKLEELMSTLIDVTRSTKIGVNLDGRAVGTGIVRATYQSA